MCFQYSSCRTISFGSPVWCISSVCQLNYWQSGPYLGVHTHPVSSKFSFQYLQTERENENLAKIEVKCFWMEVTLIKISLTCFWEILSALMLPKMLCWYVLGILLLFLKKRLFFSPGLIENLLYLITISICEIHPETIRISWGNLIGPRWLEKNHNNMSMMCHLKIV